MSEVITIRVPSGTKAILKSAHINISEEMRRYLEAKAKSIRLHGMLHGLRKRAQKIKAEGDSTQIIREYRDSR
ncbi:MAG: hypothetical protein KGH60_03345 [Candidatus Micrarchaeota archaeon]|nr:hypothetical protein [Candidatus Micrarchaeota archaeon]